MISPFKTLERTFSAFERPFRTFEFTFKAFERRFYSDVFSFSLRSKKFMIPLSAQKDRGGQEGESSHFWHDFLLNSSHFRHDFRIMIGLVGG